MKLIIKKSVERIARRCFGHCRYQKFALVGHARTGSNFLIAGIAQLYGIRIHNEVFGPHNRNKGEGFESILSGVFRHEPPWIRAVGFKVFYYHLTHDEWERIEASNIEIIHLIRQNRLRTIVSLDIAFATNRWSVKRLKDEQPRPVSIRLDTTTLVNRIQEIEAMEAEARQRFRGHKFMECTYEDLVDHTDEQFRDIADFLGIAGHIDAKRIQLVKQNPHPLTTLIENFDEVSEVLQATDYAHYLASS